MPGKLGDRNYRYSMLGIILLGIIAYLPAMVMIHKFYSDSYCYLTLAKGLRGFSYSLLAHRNLKYLPVYPISIFLVNALSLGSLGYLYSAKLVSMFSLLATACLVFDFSYDPSRSDRFPLLAGLLAVLSPVFIWMSGNILTEPLFGLLGFASYFFLFRQRNYLAWIFAGLALMTRYEGVFLIPGLALAQWKTPRQWLSGLLILAIICAPWTVFILSHLGEFFAYSYFQDMVIRTHTGFYFLADLLYGLSPLIAVLGLIGIYFYPQRLRPGVLIFVIAFSLLHIYWAWRFVRFTLPFVPFFTIGAVFFARGLLNKLQALMPARIRLITVSGLALVIIPLLAGDAYAYYSLDKFRKDFEIEAVKKVLEYDANAVVLTNIEPHLAGWSGMKHTIPWWEFGEKDPYPYIAQKYLEDGARYLIWSRTGDYPFPFFKELVAKGYVFKPTQFQGRTYTLTFYSIYFLDNGNLIIFSLDLKPAEGGGK